ncbi:MAG: RagB/SusD family nutrient uptake outer membrane protein, partial [Mariniphaga sp.]
DALTVGAYRSLPNWVNGADDWGNFLPGPIEYQTGKAYTSDSHVQFWKFQTDQVSGDLLGDFTNFWNNQYQGIRDCNMALKMLPGISDYTAVQRAAKIAQVRALRAWYYFCLVRYFGDVPMNISVITDVNNFSLPRTSLKTIYDKVIIPDLEFAVSDAGNLTDTRSTDGRVTRHVARAILADVYLTCAGYPYQEMAASTDTTKRWCVDGLWVQKGYPISTPSSISFLGKAKTQVDALVSSGTYSLWGSYDDLHNPAKNNTGEAVFQAQFLAGVLSSGGIQVAACPLGSLVTVGDGNGTYMPSLEYYNSYAPADLRTKEKQMFFTFDTKAPNYDATQSLSAVFSQPCLYKFFDRVSLKGINSSGLNWNYYRYADILLMQTEINWTLRQLGGSVADNDILTGINLVRARATLPAYGIQAVDLRTIMSERAYELVFENKMLWDQRRTRKALVDGAGAFSSIVDLVGHRPTGFSFAFGPKNLVSPIGLIEMQNNIKSLQSFGYLPKQVGQ